MGKLMTWLNCEEEGGAAMISLKTLNGLDWGRNWYINKVRHGDYENEVLISLKGVGCFHGKLCRSMGAFAIKSILINVNLVWAI